MDASTSAAPPGPDPSRSHSSPAPRAIQPEQWWRALRFGLYVLGVVSMAWFFFSFIGVAIGLAYFLAVKSAAWKRHGIVLAFCASISTFVGYVGRGLSPLYLTMLSGPVIMTTYVIAVAAWELRLKARPPVLVTRVRAWGKAHLHGKVKAATMVLLAAGPVGLWASVSLNFGVMFDNAPRLLWIHAPTTVSRDAPFPVTVEAWDAYERLSATYAGRVSFSLRSYDLETGAELSGVACTLPAPYSFTGQAHGSDAAYRIQDGKDNGLHVFTARIATPGVHYLRVADSTTGETYVSNPVLVGEYGTALPHLFWGDLHTHSFLSDGSGTVAGAFYFARQVARLDYYALTDHGEIMSFQPGAFDRLEAATNAAHVPGQFVTFPGVEWTKVKTGHYTCIFSGDELPRDPKISYLSVATPGDLWRLLDAFTARTGDRALALPHHTTKRSYPQDWTYVNPTYVKLAEVSSVHGDFLYEQRHPLNYRGAQDAPRDYTNGTAVTDALRMGYNLTLYAASDEHDGHPGHSISHTAAHVGHQRPLTTWPTRNDKPYPGGLTAVYAPTLTRDAVFDALVSRHVFAVSDHGRPVLNFTVEGRPIGGDAPVTLATPDAARTLRVTLVQDGNPAAGFRRAAAVTPGWTPNWNATVEILKNGALWYNATVTTPVAHLRVVDAAPVTGTAYGAESCLLRGDTYTLNQFCDNAVDPTTLTTGGRDFYVCRVYGANGRMAWVGPLWVANPS